MLSVQCPLLEFCQELSLQLFQSHVTHDYKPPTPLASRARQSRGVPWAAAAKTRSPDVETGAPDV